MPRTARRAPGGLIYHVLNRAAGRMKLFRHDSDYLAFLQVLQEVQEQTEMPIAGYCLMPNHWHLVLWPKAEGDLARFMQRLTITHVRRWVEHRRRVGYGSVYQGRYKSFPMQDDEHFRTVVRYVERNPLRVNLVGRAQDWAWSSLGQPGAIERYRPPIDSTEAYPSIRLCPWPVPKPRNWPRLVNAIMSPSEEEAVQRSMRHSRPLGDAVWTRRTEKRLNLPPLRPPGRPRKVVDTAER